MSLSSTATTSDFKRWTEIDTPTAATDLQRWTIIDVRGEDEFHGPLGHLPGALLRPLGELHRHVANLPADRPLLVVCRSGARSARACDLLAQHGVGDVHNLRGGMLAWAEAGLARASTATSTNRQDGGGRC